jgi:hypothetical protein
MKMAGTNWTLQELQKNPSMCQRIVYEGTRPRLYVCSHPKKNKQVYEIFLRFSIQTKISSYIWKIKRVSLRFSQRVISGVMKSKGVRAHGQLVQLQAVCRCLGWVPTALGYWLRQGSKPLDHFIAGPAEKPRPNVSVLELPITQLNKINKYSVKMKQNNETI